MGLPEYNGVRSTHLRVWVTERQRIEIAIPWRVLKTNFLYRSISPLCNSSGHHTAHTISNSFKLFQPTFQQINQIMEMSRRCRRGICVTPPCAAGAGDGDCKCVTPFRRISCVSANVIVLSMQKTSETLNFMCAMVLVLSWFVLPPHSVNMWFNFILLFRNKNWRKLKKLKEIRFML